MDTPFGREGSEGSKGSWTRPLGVKVQRVQRVQKVQRVWWRLRRNFIAAEGGIQYSPLNQPALWAEPEASRGAAPARP